jgi:hypothetical protein
MQGIHFGLARFGEVERMKVLWVLLLLAAAGAFAAPGDAFSWQSLGGDPGQQASVQLVESDLNHVVVEVTIPGFWLSTYPGGGASWDRVELPGYSPQGETGLPESPSVPMFFALPLGAQALVTVEDVEYSSFDGISLLPRQPAEIDMPHAPFPFEMNERVYSLDQQFPAAWAVVDTDGIWAGLHTSRLVVNPFRFNPAQSELLAASSIRVRIDFTGQVDGTCGRISETVEPAMAGTVINFGDFRAAGREGGTRGGAEYIVICNSTNQAAAQPLYELHNWLGLKVHVDVLPNPATSEQIFGAIADDYETGITKYALIVGDHTQMPAYFFGSDAGYNLYGDYYYACITGADLLPEIGVGRLTGTPAQITNQVNKIITGYLNFSFNDANTTGITPSETVLAAHEELYPGKYTQCCNELAAYPYSLISMTFTKVYPPEGGTAQMVSDAINNAIGTVTYRGHGSEGAWSWGPGWNATHINALTNSFMPPVFNIACLNGRFQDAGDCLAESWQIATHGCSGNLAANNPSYTEANHTYIKEIYKALYDQGIWGITAAVNAATVVTISSFGTYGQTNAKMYMWFGDPAMEIWSFDAAGEPGLLNILGPSVLNPGTQTVTLTVVNGSSQPVQGASVTFTDGTEGVTAAQTFYQEALTNASGQVSFNVTIPTTGVIHAGAFKHDFRYDTVMWTIGVGVGSGESGALPVLEMGLPVPNPVTVSASIQFSLPENGFADLSVYDISGRRIATIINGELPAGTQVVQWQPQESVASGVYFIRLTTPSGSIARQVMVVR